MSFPFTKLHGNGNDFIFLDYLGGGAPILHRREIQFFCNRHFGAGADGLVVMRPSEKASAAWDFYNSNGSEAEMCGNAARCAIHFLADRCAPDENGLISLETKAGIIRGRRLDREIIEITLLPTPLGSVPIDEKVIGAEERLFTLNLVDTGVPHAVMEVKDLRSYPILKYGHAIQKHSLFAPDEVNVTFYERTDRSKILSTTYERGVEYETYACGTGVAAAALVFAEKYMQEFPIEVTAPGGKLVVDLSPVSKHLLLRGPVGWVSDGRIAKFPQNFSPPQLYSSRRRSE